MTTSTAPPGPATPLSFTPAEPFSATYSTVLSQDVIMTDTIPVDSTSPSPAAPFVNTASGGQVGFSAVEALVVTNGQLQHVARDYSTDAGWRLATPSGRALAATEVVAGTSYAGTPDAAVFGAFQDSSALHSIQLQANGTDWSAPEVVLAETLSNLRAAYSPGGRLVVAGQTATGNLVVAYTNPTGGFVTQAYNLPTPLVDGDYALCLTDETSWTVAANAGGELWIYTGVLDGTSTGPASSGQASNYTGSVEQVVLGYWSPYQSALMFLFVDTDGALQNWTSAGVTPLPPAFPGAKVITAAAHVYLDPDSGADSINVYTVDSAQSLAVLHQDAQVPWNTDGTVNWDPYLPLDTEIAGVAIDSSPADVPSVFALTADTYSLRLHSQDATTQMWSTGEVLQSGSSAFEVARFRTEVNLIDAVGHPLPLYPVTVGVGPTCSAAAVWAGGQCYPVSSAQPASLTTDANGKLTLGLLTTSGIAAPELLLSVGGLSSYAVQPALGVHTYLSGVGTLNPTNPADPPSGAGPLPVFDAQGAGLQQGRVDGQPLAVGAVNNAQLAAVAASAIQQTAMVGLDTTPVGVAGYQVSLADPSAPTFQILGTIGQVDEATQSVLAAPGDIWSDVSGFFSDLWEGVKNGVIAIKAFVVDCASKVVNFTLEIAGEIKSGIQLAVQGVEQAAHFIAGVFQAVAADIDKVIDWLKALFDFAAIWRTKMAFETNLDLLPGYVKQLIGLGSQIGDGWFKRQEAVVGEAFAAAATKYQGTTFGQQAYFQSGGGPPDDTTAVAGGATASDFGNNVHHNWLQDKATAYAGSSTLGLQQDDSVSAPWNAFTSALETAWTDLLAALEDFGDGISTLVQHPDQFSSYAIPDFLDGIGSLVESLLALCDAVVQAFLEIASVAMSALDKILTTQIEITYLQELWAWIATAAGYPDDAELTASALISLLAAFPTTVIYKLVAGLAQEPFPPSDELATAAALGITMSAGAVLASAILQAVYVLPAAASDALGQASPMLLNIGLVGFSALIWVVGNGYPPLSAMEWVGAAVVAANLLWIAPVVYFIVGSVQSALLTWIQANINDISSTLNTVYGVGSWILHIVMDFVATPDMEQVVSGLLLPLPSLFSFLNLSAYRDDPLVAPFAITTKLIFDVVGYLGGGIARVVDALNEIYPPGAVRPA